MRKFVSKYFYVYLEHVGAPGAVVEAEPGDVEDLDLLPVVLGVDEDDPEAGVPVGHGQVVRLGRAVVARHEQREPDLHLAVSRDLEVVPHLVPDM